MRSLVEAAAAACVFAEPVTHGGCVVLPAAAIGTSLGFGFGGGGGTSVACLDTAVEIGPAGVRVHPIVDAPA